MRFGLVDLLGGGLVRFGFAVHVAEQRGSADKLQYGDVGGAHGEHEADERGSRIGGRVAAQRRVQVDGVTVGETPAEIMFDAPPESGEVGAYPYSVFGVEDSAEVCDFPSSTPCDLASVSP